MSSIHDDDTPDRVRGCLLVGLAAGVGTDIRASLRALAARDVYWGW